jgi:hypothetical protein
MAQRAREGDPAGGGRDLMYMYVMHYHIYSYVTCLSIRLQNQFGWSLQDVRQGGASGQAWVTLLAFAQSFAVRDWALFG